MKSNFNLYSVHNNLNLASKHLVQSICFNLRHLPKFRVTFCSSSLESIDEVKNLGVIFDQNLSWDAHVSHVSRNCTGTLAGLAQVRHLIPDGIITTLVTALVLSHVRYCISVYGNGSKNNMKKIQRILNFGARVIFGRRKFDPVSDLKERLGWLTAQQLAEFHTVNTAHKTMAYGEPDSLMTYFIQNCDVRERHTRRDNHLFVGHSWTDAGKRRFHIRAPDLYNPIPTEFKALPPKQFARSLRQHILDRPST